MNAFFSPTQQFFITWLLVLVTGWLTIGAIHYVAELVSVLITAGLIAFLLNYAVAKLQVFLPRGVAAALVYIVAAFVMTVIILTIAPPVLDQAGQLAIKVPELLESGRQQLEEFQTWSAERNLPFDVQILEEQLSAKVQEQVQTIVASGLGLVVGTVNWFFDLIVILVISFYMLLDGERVWQGLMSVFAPEIRYVLTETLERNLQRFISGQLLLGLFMAASLSLAFWSLHVPFFLLFAVFIGLLEVIPFIGATLGIGAVSIIVVFIDWQLALEVLGISIALQQVKDNLIAPRIMGSLTGFSPVIIFTALLLGGRVAGLLGVILAIPLTGVVKSILEIVLNPKLPPQTGSFFYNPFNDNDDKLGDKNMGKNGELLTLDDRQPSNQ
jgi:predicted PurR-regulated permease PerM